MHSVSVIVPAYNCHATLPQTIQSILQSDYGGRFEIIIVDDASDDSIEKRIPHDPRVRVVRNRFNQGPACSRNNGAGMASGDILFFIDADIRIRSNALSVIDDAFTAADIDAVVGIYDADSPYSDFFSIWYNLRARKANLDQERGFCHSAAFAIRKEIFLELGGFDQKYREPSVEDLEFGVRLAKKGLRAEVLPALAVIHDKQMSLFSLVRNDFLRAAQRAEFLFNSTVIHELATRKRFDQCSMAQLLPILLLPVPWLMGTLALHDRRAWAAVPVLLALFIVLNRRSLFYCPSGSVFSYRLKSAGFYILDLHIIFAGIAWGLARIFLCRVRRMPVLRYLPFLRHLFVKNTPVEATFFVTSRCNAACPYCFYSNNLNRRQEELSAAEAGRMFSSCGPLLRVLLSGGEPFLRDDLPDIVREICIHAAPRHITIPTNGILTRKIVEAMTRILSHPTDTVINVGISLSALQDDRDHCMGVPGSFEKTLETFHALKALKQRFPRLIVGAIVTQTASNQHQLDAIYEFARKELDVDHIGFSLVRNSPSLQEENVDIALYRSMTRKIVNDEYHSHFPFRHLYLSIRNLMYECVAFLQEGNALPLPCYSGRLRLVITPEGDVFPCETLMLRDPQKYCMGNIRDQDHDIRKVCNSLKAEDVCTFIKKTKCSCRHECDLLTNLTFNPGFLMRTMLFRTPLQHRRDAR
jgi:radical SAM protein with 4Fe4S-binding SPASM domain